MPLGKRDANLTCLLLEWEALQKVPSPFPTETQLHFLGTYDPPRCVIGKAINAVADHPDRGGIGKLLRK